MIEVWFGTPNEMEKAATKPTQRAANDWARGHLQGLIKQAEKYDRAALEAIRSIREQMLQTTQISKGDKRVWEFDYISVTVRIEVRNP